MRVRCQKSHSPNHCRTMNTYCVAHVQIFQRYRQLGITSKEYAALQMILMWSFGTSMQCQSETVASLRSRSIDARMGAHTRRTDEAKDIC